MENKKKAKGMFSLSNKVLQLLSLVTETVTEPFITEELGEKFANALNYSIERLIGQNNLKLKVRNPQEYEFDPVCLLQNLLKMYANMADEEEFRKNVVND